MTATVIVIKRSIKAKIIMSLGAHYKINPALSLLHKAMQTLNANSMSYGASDVSLTALLQPPRPKETVARMQN